MPALIRKDLNKSMIIKPVFKKGLKTNKLNYRLVCIFASSGKVFERILFDQISDYFVAFMSNIPYGFLKVYTTQDYLPLLVKKWKKLLASA